jgi:hypothetical protein
MPRKEFEAFTRLDASDVNTYLMDQSVMTFADSGARGSAIDTPVEGMLTYLEDSKSYESYDGSSYVALASGGLDLIKSQTVGSAVSSVVVSDVFSADYDNYKIVATGGVATLDGEFIKLQLGATTTGYYQAMNQVTYANVGATRNVSNGDSFAFGMTGLNGMFGNAELFLPFQTKRTSMNGILSSPATGGFYRVGSGFLNDATSYTAFTLIFANGTTTGGTIQVYGYRKE